MKLMRKFYLCLHNFSELQIDFLLFLWENVFGVISGNYADAKQSALEIGTSLFVCLFVFFFMVVTNSNASCYWLQLHCSQW